MPRRTSSRDGEAVREVTGHTGPEASPESAWSLSLPVPSSVLPRGPPGSGGLLVQAGSGLWLGTNSCSLPPLAALLSRATPRPPALCDGGGGPGPAKSMVINTVACLHIHLENCLGLWLQVQGLTVSGGTLQGTQGSPLSGEPGRKIQGARTSPSMQVQWIKTPTLPLPSSVLVLTRQPKTV